MPSNVLIANATNKDIGFQIRPRDGTWSDQQIASGKTLTYECRNCEAFEIKIVTDDKTVQKPLEGKKRYQVVWNESEKVFDIAVVDR